MRENRCMPYICKIFKTSNINQTKKTFIEMKKGLLKKGLIVLAITAAIAVTATKLQAREDAEGCIYNWNSSSFCFSDNGYPVSHCSSGPTWCYF